MIHCTNCGNPNSAESNFCRFCGHRFGQEQPTRQEPYEFSPPRPYSWKTDEFQTQSEARKLFERAQPQMNGPANLAAPGAYQGPQHLTGYHCPRCGTNYLPVIERRVSTAGWIVFSVLLVFTLVFFWIGLLMKEEVSVCPVCRAKLS